MVFDRYAINIQAFVDFIYAFFMIVRSSSSQNLIKHDVKEDAQDFETNSSIFKFPDSQIWKFNIFQRNSYKFLIFVKYVW